MALREHDISELPALTTGGRWFAGDAGWRVAARVARPDQPRPVGRAGGWRATARERLSPTLRPAAPRRVRLLAPAG